MEDGNLQKILLMRAVFSGGAKTLTNAEGPELIKQKQEAKAWI